MNEQTDVPFIVYESAMAREERHAKRLSAIILAVVMLWFSTIALFIWYITLPVEEVTDTQMIEGTEYSTIT